jgi:hypothetical protein
MKKEEKESLIEYMIKHCGFTYNNALKKFEKWYAEKFSGNGNSYIRRVAEDKKMTKDQMDTMIIYMHKQGFTNEWIVRSLGTLNCHVSKAIRDYEELIREKKV